MNYFQKYLKVIQEDTAEDRYWKRKGITPKEDLNPYEQLEKYKDDPNVYISFRSIDKIGINPMSEYNTPNGIYTYPLKKVWSRFDHEDKKIKVPFAGEKLYIYVVKAKPEAKVLDLDSYSVNDLEADIKKLKASPITSKFDIDRFKETQKRKHGDDFGKIIWSVTYQIVTPENKKDFQFRENKPNLWNRIMKKVLGYDYAVDTGKGTIHKNEPTQAVFFSTSAFDTIDIIKNKRSIKRDKIARVWEGGTFTKKVWEDGIWKGGTFKGKVWGNGIWNNGTFEGHTWRSGVWKNGTWKGVDWWGGTWKKGTWKSGAFGGGTWWGGTFEGGYWKNGTWKGGIWKGGEWGGGYDKHGNFHPAGDSPDKWKIKK